MEDEGTEWRRPPALVAAAAAARLESEKAAAAVLLEHAQAAESLARDMTPTDPASPLMPLVEEFYRDGLAVLEQGISNDQVERCIDVVDKGYQRYMHTVRTLDLQERLQDVGFMEIKMRSSGRYDLQVCRDRG
jgi:ribosomal protein S12 methylthiotransferase accessory factor YcaO